MLYRTEICVISAREWVTRKGNARSLTNGKGETLIRNLGETLETPVVTLPAPPFRAIIAGKRVIYPVNVGESGGNRGRRENSGQMADMARTMAAMQEVLKKLVPEAVFP